MTRILIAECGGLSILLDFYHAELEEPSVPAAVFAAAGQISWVQVSDSNRKAEAACLCGLSKWPFHLPPQWDRLPGQGVFVCASS